MKKLRKQLNEQKKKLEQKNTELKYEQTRDAGGSVEVSDLELAKANGKKKLQRLTAKNRILMKR